MTSASSGVTRPACTVRLGRRLAFSAWDVANQELQSLGMMMRGYRLRLSRKKRASEFIKGDDTGRGDEVS